MAPLDFEKWLELVEEVTPQEAAAFLPGALTYRMAILNFVGALLHAICLIIELAMQVRFNMRLEITTLETPRVLDPATGLNVWSPVFRATGDSIYVTWLALSVHFMAFASHFIVFVCLALSYHPDYRTASYWYRHGLFRCRAPWRWLEYVGSATAMILFLATVTGIREDQKVATLGVLCATTMLFGWMTEVHSSELIEKVEPPVKGRFGWEYHYQWRPHSWPDRLVWHHLLGYVPFSLMFWLILDIFWSNKAALEAVDEGWPLFVDLSVYGSIMLFSLFGVTQLVQQYHDYGPSWYWAGEASYVVLSFTAKAWLILLATFNALLPSSQFDELLDAKF